jgi:hypothetical protein
LKAILAAAKADALAAMTTGYRSSAPMAWTITLATWVLPKAEKAKARRIKVS